ncbi:MAG: YfiR family protein [Verrucomicrobia bacterium]|nr:YfiR family protein [Verrucomicrobiota bacterium]
MCLALLLLGFALCVGAGRGDDALLAIKVKAAALLNFVRFTEWPDRSFAKPDAPLVIGVVGDDPIGPVLEKTFEGKTVGARAIRIVRFAATGPGKATAAQLRECHLLFVPKSENARIKEHIEAVAGNATLTVSDAEGFCALGGMIELGMPDGKLKFSINRKAAEAAGLKLSAKFLQLGTIVEGKVPGA